MKTTMTTRTLTAKPNSYDAESRSLRAVATTEKPAKVIDWGRWDIVDEVLRMDGAVLPQIKQVPLLDSHNRGSVGDVIGSARDFSFSNIDGYKCLECNVYFSDDEKGRSIEKKFADGHITDFSIGYEVKESTWIDDGQKGVVSGDEYEGPLKVATSWSLKELSATPIGADDLAKARSEYNNQQEHKQMRKKELFENQAETESQVQAEVVTEVKGLTEDQAKAMARDAVEADRKRSADIKSAVRKAGLDIELADKLIEEGKDINEAREVIIEEMSNKHQAIPRVEAGVVEKDKFREAVVDGMLARNGLSESTNEFRGRTLIQICEESMKRAGVSLAGKRNMEIAALALRHSSSDLPYIMANVAHKTMQKAYSEYPSTYEPWVSITDGSDFKTNYRPQLSEGPDLSLINEGGEYTYASLSEFQETNQIKTYGKGMLLTRQAIVNDDRSAFTRIPKMFGNAAVRRINDLVYATLTTPQTMGYDSTALFHADHSNLTSSGTALSASSLSVARKIMRLQTGPDGQVLNIMPQFLLVPAELETTTEIILRSTASTDDSKNTGVINPWRNQLVPIVEPRLSADDVNAWYLVASPNQIDTIEVMFLDGVRTPYIDDEVDFDTDALRMKCRIDVGVRALDHRGFYKNVGA